MKHSKTLKQILLLFSMLIFIHSNVLATEIDLSAFNNFQDIQKPIMSLLPIRAFVPLLMQIFIIFIYLPISILFFIKLIHNATANVNQTKKLELPDYEKKEKIKTLKSKYYETFIKFILYSTIVYLILITTLIMY